MVKYYSKIAQVPYLTEEEKERLLKVENRFAFRANDYYLRLIRWDDPTDPIRRIIIPTLDELEEWGKLDASNEKRYTVQQGLEHKYPDTALFLTSQVCGSYCRFCFRKRLFIKGSSEVTLKIKDRINYIRLHPEITNVLLSGGDPLILSTRKLVELVSALSEIEHLRFIRIGTKAPAFNPFRITDDPELEKVVSIPKKSGKGMYIVTQFNHPRELTDEAKEAVRKLLSWGAILLNQTPLLRGINDDPDTLRELFVSLVKIGISPYYIFQNRPVLGNRHFSVPIPDGIRIIREAKRGISGLAGRIIYAMSHTTGKIEIVGCDEKQIYLKYHRAANPENHYRVLTVPRKDDALWFDDLV
ncbi:KamA family radical SAM protein [bacterium]|nr:KamA family radical SAM protein [bacterium]